DRATRRTECAAYGEQIKIESAAKWRWPQGRRRSFFTFLFFGTEYHSQMLKFLRGPFAFITATMFLNFAGLTIIIPVIPYIVSQYTTSVALWVGLIMSVAALFQFLLGPGLGYLSDIYGRRPVLLWSLLGGVVGYVLFGI